MPATPTTQPKTRWDEIVDIWQRDKWLYGVIGLVTGFIFGIAASDYLSQILTWFASGFWNEALSITITVIVLNRLSKSRAEQERKEELIFQLGSEESVVAKQAARLLRYKGWLTDGSLKDVKLEGANLQGADLTGANLQNVNLVHANLADAKLNDASLQGVILRNAVLDDANLERANLTGAKLSDASLQGVTLYYAKLIDTQLWRANLTGAYLPFSTLARANLGRANLADANLAGANLQGTMLDSANLAKTHMVNANLQGAFMEHADLAGSNLGGARLQGALLRGANLDENVRWQTEKLFSEGVFTATLPDGTEWDAGRDMEAFTNKEHSDFETTRDRIIKIREQQQTEK